MQLLAAVASPSCSSFHHRRTAVHRSCHTTAVRHSCQTKDVRRSCQTTAVRHSCQTTAVRPSCGPCQAVVLYRSSNHKLDFQMAALWHSNAHRAAAHRVSRCRQIAATHPSCRSVTSECLAAAWTSCRQSGERITRISCSFIDNQLFILWLIAFQ